MSSAPPELADRVYRLSPKDMDEVISLVDRLANDRKKYLDDYEKELKQSKPDVVDDAMDDLRYYQHCEYSFLWEACVWRLQGIFEGILEERFLLHKRKYIGLHDRLNSVEKERYSIEDRRDVERWANFRNGLSHNPPKQILGHGYFIGKREIVKFRNFLVAVLRKLEAQRLT